jgi:hypothetical protein
MRSMSRGRGTETLVQAPMKCFLKSDRSVSVLEIYIDTVIYILSELGRQGIATSDKMVKRFICLAVFTRFGLEGI